MSSWPEVVQTVVPAALTGAVGFYSARWQARSQLAVVDAENQRLHASGESDARHRRADVYREYLFALQRLAAYGRNIRDVTWADWHEWLEQYEPAYMGIRLLAPASVVEAALDMGKVLKIVAGALRGVDQTNDVALKAALTQAFESNLESFTDARYELEMAMRREIGLDETRVWKPDD